MGENLGHNIANIILLFLGEEKEKGVCMYMCVCVRVCKKD